MLRSHRCSLPTHLILWLLLLLLRQLSLSASQSVYKQRVSCEVLIQPAISLSFSIFHRQPAPMASADKVHTFEDVSSHNQIKDCWLIIAGKVYDVTAFMEEHPGGEEVLLSATGKDATDDFEDVGHSDDARKQMETFCIGTIDTSTVPKKRTYAPPLQAHYNQDKTMDFVIKILQFLVPLLILGLALVVRRYTKKDD